MPFTKANDISIYYEIHGETGSPLVMIAGLGATIMTWTPELIVRLGAAHRVIIFDNRGAGQTDVPDGPYTMAQFAADTARLLDALGLPRAHFRFPGEGASDLNPPIHRRAHRCDEFRHAAK